MTLSNLLQVLEQKSVQLSSANGKLSFTAPQGAVDDELKLQLKAHKQALLDIYSTAPQPRPCHERQADVAAASQAQRGLWFTEQLDVPANVYAVNLAWRCYGDLNTSYLQTALNTLVARHESLRTTLSVDESNTLVQSVNPAVPVPFTLVPVTNNERDWRDAAQHLLNMPFALDTDQLIRAVVYQLDPRQHIVLVATHHVAVDGWSVNVLTRELEQLYNEQLSQGIELPDPDNSEEFAQANQLLSPLNYQYLEYTRWQEEVFQTASFVQQLSYWKDTLSGTLPVINLPTDHVRPAVATYNGGSVRLPLPTETLAQLNHHAQQSGSTLYTLLFSLFSVFLYRYTNDEEQIIGTPVSNRDNPAFEQTVGLFTNTLPIRTTVSPTQSLSHYLQAFRRTMAGALAAQAVPFETLVRELAPERDLSRNPLYQVMFTLQNVTGEPLSLRGLEIETIVDLDSDSAKFDLALEIVTQPGNADIHFSYSRDLFDEPTITTLAQLFQHMLGSFRDYLDTPVNHIPLVSATERDEQLALGRGATSDDLATSIIELFDGQLADTPDSTAFVYSGERISYQAFADIEQSIYNELQRAQCTAGHVVALRLPRSVNYIASVLAVLRCGAIWCPIGPTLPASRQEFLVTDSRARFIISVADGCENGLPVKVLAVDVSGDVPDVSAVSEVSAVLAVSEEVSAVLEPSGPHNVFYYGSDAAYLFYTSGSSGKPKGVVGTHRGLINRLHWMWQRYPFVDDEVACIKTSTSFIDSLWECFGALLVGKPSVITPESESFNLHDFLDTLTSHSVSRLVLVPSLLSAILDELDDSPVQLTSLQLCICSGEALSANLARRFYRVFPEATLINLYGLSEVTADATYYEVPRDQDGVHVPLGRSINNSTLYILDDKKSMLPRGMQGDIYIAGHGLAKGYHLQTELTDEVFTTDPFGGGLMFKTGDRGRWNNEGVLAYGGRLDKQCKILGIRVDCGEVESTLVQMAAVNQARVFAETRNETNRLIAHIEVNASTTVETQTIRDYLKACLPSYLIPSKLFLHDKFPSLPNGKVDLITLKNLRTSESPTTVDALETRTPEQENMLSLWADVLASDMHSLQDNFFDLGGHSLLAVSLLKAINRDFSGTLSVSTFFKNPTPQGCLAALTAPAEGSQHESSLTVLKQADGGLPIFMMPPSSYTSAFFQRLKQCLPNDCSLYSIDTQMALEYETLEALCARITDDILRVQPRGPWMVGGTCFGNHLAFEISNLLRSRTGGDVTLFLIDSRAPLSGPTWSVQSTGQTGTESRLSFIVRVLMREYKRDRLRSFISKRLRRARGRINPVVGAFIEVGFWQDKQFVKYRANKGDAKIVLLQSEQFQNDIHSNAQWQALTSQEVHYVPIAAKHHHDLASHKSLHWKQVAAEIIKFNQQSDTAS